MWLKVCRGGFGFTISGLGFSASALPGAEKHTSVRFRHAHKSFGLVTIGLDSSPGQNLSVRETGAPNPKP